MQSLAINVLQSFSNVKFINYAHSLFLSACLLIFTPQLSLAAGLTPAGTVISNIATVGYSIASVPQPPMISAPAMVTVDEVIHPLLTWQDAAPVPVGTPSANDALEFLLTNAGNGQEAFSLTRTNGPLPLPAGNYTPLNGTVGSIYLETNGTAGFQPTDTAYVSGTNDPVLPAGAGQIIYVVSDTPVVANNIQGEVKLDAASLTPGVAGSAPGTSFAGLGTGGVFAVTGTNSGQAGATGSYISSGLGVVVTKSVTGVVDPNGGAAVMPGSVMNYQIAVALTGTGTATNLVISDPLPSQISFVSGSLYLDGVLQPDAVANTINVSLGNVAAPANFVITFSATIN
jgi:uncharacterized repeat protein (TIGR01451 family)